MTRMKLIPRLPLNEIGHSPGGPQSGAIAQGFRTLLETAADSFQLSRLQARLSASAARFLKRPLAVGFPSLVPSTDRLPMHVELAGHLGLAQALVKETGGLKSPLLQLVKIAFNAFWVAHAQRLARESISVTIFYDIQ